MLRRLRTTSPALRWMNTPCGISAPLMIQIKISGSTPRNRPGAEHDEQACVTTSPPGLSDVASDFYRFRLLQDVTRYVLDNSYCPVRMPSRGGARFSTCPGSAAERRCDAGERLFAVHARGAVPVLLPDTPLDHLKNFRNEKFRFCRMAAHHSLGICPSFVYQRLPCSIRS